MFSGGGRFGVDGSGTHFDDLCALDEDAVEEGRERLDRLDGEGLVGGRGGRG